MRAMTDPLSGTRAHRARIANETIGYYEAWLREVDRTTADLPEEVIGSLAICTRWLLQLLDAQPGDTAAATRRRGQANTAVAGLNARQLREVLYAIAADSPRQVLNAIAEAGA